MTNRLETFDHDHVNDLLEYMETAFRGGDGIHELRDAFGQYLALSDDSKGMKMARKEMFDSLMVALMEFDEAQA
jgi:hypothetical protein